MDQNTLLALMLASYIAPIGFVYYKYKTAASGARSISSIITSCEPLFSCENDTGGGHATKPTIIPRETLHRSVYVHYGMFHNIIRNPAKPVVFSPDHRPPHRDIRCHLHPRNKPRPLHLRRHRIHRDSRVYDSTYCMPGRHCCCRPRQSPHPSLRAIPVYDHHRHRGHPRYTYFHV